MGKKYIGKVEVFDLYAKREKKKRAIKFTIFLKLQTASFKLKLMVRHIYLATRTISSCILKHSIHQIVAFSTWEEQHIKQSFDWFWLRMSSKFGKLPQIHLHTLKEKMVISSKRIVLYIYSTEIKLWFIWVINKTFWNKIIFQWY